jgi:hypothetical protein
MKLTLLPYFIQSNGFALLCDEINSLKRKKMARDELMDALQVLRTAHSIDDVKTHFYAIHDGTAVLCLYAHPFYTY